MPDQGQLFDAPGGVVTHGPWVAVCGDPGPYAIRRPTPKSPQQLEVLSCTRPRGHDGPLHAYADADARVLASWHRNGTANYPPVIRSTFPQHPRRS